jgi:hypothetical protein
MSPSRILPQQRFFECRRIKVTTALNAYLQDKWSHIVQVAQLTRTITLTKAGKTSHEVVYLITTLCPQQASPKRLLSQCAVISIFGSSYVDEL